MPLVTLPVEIEFIVGPQLKLNSPENPFPYFDQVQATKGVFHGTNFPASPPTDGSSDAYMNAQYYDLGLCLYALYYRSGDPAHLALARKVTDSWWRFSPINEGRTPIESSMTPRNSSIGGLILRALDGRAEMWDWLARFTRFQFDSWVKRNITGSGLVNGVRDGGYMLLYAAWLGKVLPDATLRAGFLADAENAAANYYLRLQSPDGSWRWGDSYYTDADGGQLRGIMQPFQVGLLLHALIDVYRITSNSTLKANIKTSVLKALDHLYTGGPWMARNAGIPGSPLRWRGFHYFYHGGTTVNPTKYVNGDYVGTSANASNIYSIEGVRQATSTVFHAVGWAYKETGDPKYAAMGDEYLESIVGFKDSINGTPDQVSNYINGNDPKGYNQHFRCGGRYLAWRYGSGVATPPVDNPPPPPPPPPPVEPVDPPPTGGIRYISGSVKKDGAPAVGVRITVHNASGVETAGMPTTSLGTYIFNVGTAAGSVRAPAGYTPSSYPFEAGTANISGKNFVSAVAPPPPPPPPPVEPTGPVVGTLKKDIPWTISETADTSEARKQRALGFYFHSHQAGKKATFVYTGVKIAT